MNQIHKTHWTTSAALSLNTTHLIVVSYDGSDAANNPTIYIDNNRYTVGSNLTRNENSPAEMGAITSGQRIDVGGGRPNSNVNRFAVPNNLEIGEVAIWKTEMPTTTFIDTVYAGGTMPNLSGSRVENSSNLVCWWRFGDNPNDSAGVVTSGSFSVANAAISSHTKNALKAVGTREDARFHSGGSFAISASTAYAIHSSTTFTDENKYDNYYVQHTLPRNHTNYSWIRKSVDPSYRSVGMPTASNSIPFITGSNFHSYRDSRGPDNGYGLLWGIPLERISKLTPIEQTATQFTDFAGLNRTSSASVII